MTGLLELADRCEKATGSDSRLEREIDKALGGKGHYLTAEPVTQSADSALAFVPDGWRVRDLTDWTHDPELGFWSVELRRLGFKHHAVEGEAKTPALALCAAALRARAQHTPEPKQ